MKHSAKKLLSLLLALLMTVSLMGGTLVYAASDEPFEAATALEEGYDYVIVTELDGAYYALTTTGESSAAGFDKAPTVTIADGKITEVPKGAVWTPEDGNLKSVDYEKLYVFAGSGGFMTFNGGRTFSYDAATGIVTMHSKYYLGFSGGMFTQDEDIANAAVISLYRRVGAPVVKQDPNNWEGKVDPSTVPETNNVPAVTKTAVKHDDGSIVLAFTSDVHYDGVHNNLKTWLEKAEEKYGYIDSMGFCGDMGSAYKAGDAYWEAAEEMMQYIDSQIEAGKIGTATYTFGNHEWFLAAGGEYMQNNQSAAAKRLLRVGESVKTDDYIIYNFGASPDAGFDWVTYGYNTKYMYTYYEDDLKALDTYLSSAPKDIPIFILTHYPLHSFEDRTISSSAQIIEVLNKYPNVVVLWGHNHSNKDPAYYYIRHAGDELVIDQNGTKAKINFDYLSAGTTADAEYTSPDAGSAWTLNKGLIVTINKDKTLKYDYITLTGDIIEEGGKTLVAYRNNIDYKITSVEYVDVGGSVTPPQVPEIEGYIFTGWNVDFSSIKQPTLATAVYKADTGLDENTVYLTIYNGSDVAIGKSGKPVLLYPIPYTKGMTALDLLKAVQDKEFSGGSAGVEAGSYGQLTPVWGIEGTFFMNDPSSSNGYIKGTDAVAGGSAYYITAGSEVTAMVTPYTKTVVKGGTLSMSASKWVFNTSTYYYDPTAMSGDVYMGTSLNALADTGVDAKDGKFSLSFTKDGTFYVAVKSEGVVTAATLVTVKKPNAAASTQTFKFNGEEVKLEAYNIDGYNYVRLRDVASLLNGTGSSFSVSYDNATKKVSVVTGEAYIPDGSEMVISGNKADTAMISPHTIIINGAEASPAMYSISGNNYLKLSELGELLGFGVEYDKDSDTAVITAK